MQNLIVKIKQAIKQIEAEKGLFKIKCLVAKDLSNIQWDLIVSADWFDADPIKRLDYLSKQILSDLDINCMLQFSGIVAYESQVSNALIHTLIRIQEEYANGKYSDCDQIKSPDESVKLIIPLNEVKAEVSIKNS